MQVRLGVDVGGTFTDVVVVRQDGRAFVSKVTTTPDDPGEGVIAGIRTVLEQAS
jgi:N-methylhydantoinase A